ncbi:MAG: 5'-nucleotidase C-terminal domain-containing protein [Clostridium sp.]|nr:5'-nucleotidase C-terminal domain-containing protein [Clostridium sp.]
MKHNRLFISTVAATLAFLSITSVANDNIERIVLLHTNDTHSQIDPDGRGRGGVVRRKALIDSIRSVEPAVMLIDAGDAVQGTPYFTLFGGSVEQGILNRLGYDIQILGNHEFDNGVPALAKNYIYARPTILSTNNLFDGTDLENIVVPWVVKQAGTRRIGFVGVNINPEGLVDLRKSKGVRYVDAVDAVQPVVDFLRDSAKVDAVVAVTHIGFTKKPDTPGYTDPMLAAATRGIDLIIGGHSHTDLQPGSPETFALNLDGDTAMIVQNRNAGISLGEVTLLFDRKDGLVGKEWKKIQVTPAADRLPQDTALIEFLIPYRVEVDSLMNERVGSISGDFSKTAMANFAADFVYERGRQLNGGRYPDLAIMNKGGIRHNFSGTDMTVGTILSVFPFENKVVLLDLKGSELRKLFAIFARYGGQGVSRNVSAVFNPEMTDCETITISGKPIDDNRTYRVATIDYLAGGNDDMRPLANGRLIRSAEGFIYDDMMEAFRRGIYSGQTVCPDERSRMAPRGSSDFELENH